MDVVPQNASSRSRLGRLIAKFRDGEYRDSYVRSHTKQFLARQMRTFRGDRTQTEFAEVLDVSQSVVSERLENPNYGNLNLNTLFETAAKLKVAVFVRFVDFETFLKLSSDMSDNAIRPPEYNQGTLDALAERQEEMLREQDWENLRQRIWTSTAANLADDESRKPVASTERKVALLNVA